MNRKVINVITVILAVLFAWVIYPIRWWRKGVYTSNKRKAYEGAKKQSEGNFMNVYVIQNGLKFYYGTRSQLRRFDKRASKVLRKKTRVLDYDYRNAIVAVFRNGKKEEKK